jgi:hypothetical protein
MTGEKTFYETINLMAGTLKRGLPLMIQYNSCFPLCLCALVALLEFYCEIRTSKLAHSTAVALVWICELSLFLFIQNQRILWAELNADSTPFTPFCIDHGFLCFCLGHGTTHSIEFLFVKRFGRRSGYRQHSAMEHSWDAGGVFHVLLAGRYGDGLRCMKPLLDSKARSYRHALLELG